MLDWSVIGWDVCIYFFIFLLQLTSILGFISYHCDYKDAMKFKSRIQQHRAPVQIKLQLFNYTKYSCSWYTCTNDIDLWTQSIRFRAFNTIRLFTMHCFRVKFVYFLKILPICLLYQTSYLSTMHHTFFISLPEPHIYIFDPFSYWWSTSINGWQSSRFVFLNCNWPNFSLVDVSLWRRLTWMC